MSNHSTRSNARTVEVNSVSNSARPNTALNYLAYIFQDARVHELRFIDPTKQRRPKSFVWRPGMINIKEELEKARRRRDNCYVTVNPVRDDHPDDKAASAGDIVRRWHIPIDIDPIRATGTLASDEQRQAAANVGSAVLEWYAKTFPDHASPFSGCSGSGWQILIPADMETDAKSNKLVARLFEAMGKQFDTEAAKIDQSVKDLPRIMRVCGTVAFYANGETRGYIDRLPTGEGRRVTADDLLAYLGEEKQPAKTGKSKPAGRLPVLTVPSRTGGWDRFRAYIERALADIQFAPDTTKYRTVVAKSAHIANLAAGFGLENRKQEIKELVMSALRQNASEVNSWAAMEQAFDDMWEKGIDDARLPEDRQEYATESTDDSGTQASSEAKAGNVSADDELEAPTYNQWAENRAAMVWHWPGWIPSNQLVLVSGDCFAGKSTLLVYLLVLMTTGKPWPDGSTNKIESDRPVLYLDADNRSDLIGDAFRRAGGDTEKLRLATLPGNIHTPLFLNTGESFEILRKYIKGTNPSCVVIDTIARASDIDLTSPQQLSAFTKPLAQMAQDFSVPIFMLGHTNASGQAYGRHVQAVITSSWLVSHDTITGRRTLSCEFTRAARPDSISFDIGESGCENFSVLAIPEGGSVTEQADNAIITILATANQGLTYSKVKNRFKELNVGSESTFKRSLTGLQKSGRVKTRPYQPSDGSESFTVYYTDEQAPQPMNQTPASSVTPF